MNDRPTPETDEASFTGHRDCDVMECGIMVWASFAAKLERERDELREQNAALRDALRVRIEEMSCPECGCKVLDFFQHAETCRHYATEQKVLTP